MSELPPALRVDSLETPRIRLGYRRSGEPGGLPILFVHGGFASSLWWTPLFALLPTEFDAVALDLRGCGRSDKPADGYSIESQAADLAAFVDTLGWQDFDLVAHAAGGAIAVEYLLGHNDQVRSLTLVSTVPLEGVSTPDEVVRLLDRMRTDPQLLRSALAALAPALSARPDPLFEQMVAEAAAMAPAAFTEVTLALGRWNRMADARRLTLPCLLVWGDADPLVTRETITRTLLATPGAANLEVLQGVGHSPMVDAPLAFAERLVDFVIEDFSGLADVRARGHQ